jgi:hypothetical protein
MSSPAALALPIDFERRLRSACSSSVFVCSSLRRASSEARGHGFEVSSQQVRIKHDGSSSVVERAKFEIRSTKSETNSKHQILNRDSPAVLPRQPEASFRTFEFRISDLFRI